MQGGVLFLFPLMTITHVLIEYLSTYKAYRITISFPSLLAQPHSYLSHKLSLKVRTRLGIRYVRF